MTNLSSAFKEYVDVWVQVAKIRRKAGDAELEETFDQTDQTIGNCRFVSKEPSMTIDAIDFQQEAHPETETAVDCGNQVEAR